MYPKYKYSKTEIVLVLDEVHEEELGDSFFNSPVDAQSDFDYEGKISNPKKVKSK
jgi:hypothetical protein